MNIVRANPAEPIRLGRQGEKGVTRVEFDLLLFVQEHGHGTAQLLVKRAGEAAVYPADLDQSGTTATWDIGAEWTAAAGCGYCELNWYVGDTLAKSEVFRTEVLRSLEGETMDDAPDPVAGYVAQVQEAAARAEAAQGAAEAAQSSAKAAQSSAKAAQTAAKASQTAAETATQIACEAIGNLVTTEKQGDVVRIDDLSQYGSVEFTSFISPGAGGCSEVKLTRYGKNMIGRLESGVYSQSTGGKASAPGYVRMVDYARVETGKTYVVSKDGTAATGYFHEYDADKNWIRRAVNTTQYTTPDGVFYVRWNSSTDGYASTDNVQLEMGSVATAFEQYQEPKTFAIDLGQTVYGGSLDWSTGLLTVTHDENGEELLEPVTVQLTPHEVEVLGGAVNTFYSDTGDTRIVYGRDMMRVIEELRQAIIVLGGTL